MMNLEKLEDLMYLIRMNLYDDVRDWRDAKVVMIANDTITLEKDGSRDQWNIDELEKICNDLHDKHWSEVEEYLKGEA